MAKTTDKPRIIFTIEGDFDLEAVGAEEAILVMQEAVEKLREQGSAHCRAKFPEHERAVEP